MDFTIWNYLHKRYINVGGDMIPLDVVDDKDYYCICDDEGTIWGVQMVQKGKQITPDMILETYPDDERTYNISKVTHLEFAEAFIRSQEAIQDSVAGDPTKPCIFPKHHKFLNGTADVKARRKSGAIERKMINGAWEKLSGGR